MRSLKPQALASVSILASTMLLVAGCASGQHTLELPTACSSLVGPSLRADVAPVDMPTGDATAGDLWTALDGQTGRLDIANSNRRAVLEVVEGCEARDAATVKRLNAPWWRRLFLPPPDS
jgi:hypothetical protein